MPRNSLKCGSVMANNFQVTMVAWYLDMPIPWVQALPQEAADQAGTERGVPRRRDKTRRNQGPTAAQMAAWERGWQNLNDSHYKIIKPTAVTLYMDCSTYSALRVTRASRSHAAAAAACGRPETDVMYLPKHFSADEHETRELLDGIRAADLVTPTADGLFATFLPLIYDALGERSRVAARVTSRARTTTGGLSRAASRW